MSPALADPAQDAQSVSDLPREERLGHRIVSEDETIILMIRPSAWFVVATSVNALPAAVAAGAVLALATIDDAIPWNTAGALLASLAILLARFLWQSVDWFLRLYILTDRRIVVRRGAIPEVCECSLSEIAGIGLPRRRIERFARTGSLAVMRGSSSRARSASRARQVGQTRREGPRVRVDHSLEWSVIRKSDETRRTILAAVSRFR
ncbi:MAG: hypothetical protein EXS03_03605 [Phycisphaerales bacterium]|nr:hypothetical protein [Phycisphaerales bacterium]